MSFFSKTPSFSFDAFFCAKIFCQKIENFAKINSPEYLLYYPEKEKKYAEIFIGWSEKGIILQAQMITSPKTVSLDETIELFFDTRDLKSKNHFTRYCHHFLFEPANDAFLGKEITRFISDDTHTLAQPEAFEIGLEYEKKTNYKVKIFLPASILFGYDPTHFPKIGFAYHIKKKSSLEEQSFPCVKEFSLKKNPSLWSSLELCP